MIIRLIWWSLKIISICIIVAFIANQEGKSQIVWVGWKMEIPTSILFGGFLLSLIAIIFETSVVTFFNLKFLDLL